MRLTSVEPTLDLDIPHRIAVVIERYRPIGGADQVFEYQFQSAPETCDLDLDVIRANIGKATIILDSGWTRPLYDRAERVTQAARLVLGLMPQAGAAHAVLRNAGFGSLELGELWNEIVDRAADDFAADRAPKVPPLGIWAPEILERSAN